MLQALYAPNSLPVAGPVHPPTLSLLQALEAPQPLPAAGLLHPACLPPNPPWLQALYALVQRAGVDIRSCLNTLQLLAKQAAQLQRPGKGSAHRQPLCIKSKQVRPMRPQRPPLCLRSAPKCNSSAQKPTLRSGPLHSFFTFQAQHTHTGTYTQANQHAHTCTFACMPTLCHRCTPVANQKTRARANSHIGAWVPMPTCFTRANTSVCARALRAQVEQLNIGIKDTTKGVFAVWDELLHLPGRGGMGALHLGAAGEGDAGGARRIQRLYSALQDFGEHELVGGGHGRAC